MRMAITGAYLTIIYTVLLHFRIVATNSWIFNIFNNGTKLIVFPFKGLVFISYPLIGLLADTKFTCYRMICLSCWILFISYAVVSILSILVLTGTIMLYS